MSSRTVTQMSDRLDAKGKMEFRLGAEQWVYGPGDVMVFMEVRGTRLGFAKIPR